MPKIFHMRFSYRKLLTAQCTLHTAPSPSYAPAFEPLHFTLHNENCILHIYHFTLKTSKICLCGSQNLQGKMNLNAYISLYKWVFQMIWECCSSWGRTTLVAENCSSCLVNLRKYISMYCWSPIQGRISKFLLTEVTYFSLRFYITFGT